MIPNNYTDSELITAATYDLDNYSRAELVTLIETLTLRFGDKIDALEDIYSRATELTEAIEEKM